MSRETDALIKFIGLTGTPNKVTSTTGGTHTPTSYHYRVGTDGRGLAVDFAGPVPSYNSPALLAIFSQFAKIERSLAELFYTGAPYNIKNGQRIPRIGQHYDHVHVAVEKGFTYNGSQGVAVPDNDPNLPDITGPVDLMLLSNSNGECTGYYIFSHTTGELHSFGPGARFYGRSEVVRLVAT